jgi:hypothetical protein
VFLNELAWTLILNPFFCSLPCPLESECSHRPTQSRPSSPNCAQGNWWKWLPLMSCVSDFLRYPVYIQLIYILNKVELAAYSDYSYYFYSTLTQLLEAKRNSNVSKHWVIRPQGRRADKSSPKITNSWNIIFPTIMIPFQIHVIQTLVEMEFVPMSTLRRTVPVWKAILGNYVSLKVRASGNLQL